MDNAGAMSVITNEKLVEMWNHNISFSLSVSDLSPTVKPTVLMGALMEILHKLGIDRDAIIAAPPEEERDEHTEYYWDLIPVLNMTRILNYVFSGFQDNFTTTMMDLLNPSPRYAQSILLLLLNLASFYASRREDIAPREQELFEHRDQVAALEEQMNQLLGLLNEQAAAKASRSMHLQKLEEDKRKVSEELKRERCQHEEQLRELDRIAAENRELQALVDKRKLQKEALSLELARVKSQKVNDVEDIRAQYEQAVRAEKEVTQQLDSLKETLLQKEATVKNLQAVKSKLDEGIHYVLEITTLTDTFREVNLSTNREQADVEAAVSSRAGALREAEAQLAELQRERRALSEQRESEAADTRQALALAHSGVKEAEARWCASVERAERAEERARAVRARVEAYALEKQQLEEALQRVRPDFESELKSFEEQILQHSKKAVRTIEDKFNRVNKR